MSGPARPRAEPSAREALSSAASPPVGAAPPLPSPGGGPNGLPPPPKGRLLAPSAFLPSRVGGRRRAPPLALLIESLELLHRLLLLLGLPGGSLALQILELLALLGELLVEVRLLRVVGRGDRALHLLLGAKRPMVHPLHAAVHLIALPLLVLLHPLVPREHLRELAPLLAL